MEEKLPNAKEIMSLSTDEINNAFDDEGFILRCVSDLFNNEIALFPQCCKTVRLRKYLSNINLWTNNSADTLHPPDFYSNELKMMIDVMKISEYTYMVQRGKKTKYINPMWAHESEQLKNRDNCIFLEGEQNPIVLPDGDKLIGIEHNYRQYLEDFKRVVGEHNRKIPLYEENHPGFKTILFVFDESSQYVVSEKPLRRDDTKKDNICCATAIHHWFLDKNFVDFISSLNCEYLVWLTPWKNNFRLKPWSEPVPKMPLLCIFKISDCKNIQTIVYDENLLVSVEDNSTGSKS